MTYINESLVKVVETYNQIENNRQMMTNPIKLITTCSVAASVLLSSCSTKFKSKVEAENAKDEFLWNGKEVVVITTPTDREIEDAKKDARIKRARECKRAEEKLNSAINHPYGKGKIANTIAIAYARQEVAEKCSLNPNADEINKETLTRRVTKNTRKCFDEFETRQFVCETSKTNKDEMTWEEWLELKTYYTYFRY